MELKCSTKVNKVKWYDKKQMHLTFIIHLCITIIFMMIKIIELEEMILQNKHYLLKVYPDTQEILSQIAMILDFGMDSKKVEEWLAFNRSSLTLIYELLEEKGSDESFTC